MADAAVADRPVESTDLVAIKVLTPAVVFAPGGVDKILGKIEAEVRSVKTDISTEAGRDAIKSLAYKVARSKTALDEMGKTLVAEWKAKANAVDAERRTIRDRLDALKEEVRKPVTDWESADRQRIDEHEQHLERLNRAAVFDEQEPTVAAIKQRENWLSGFAHNRDWQEFAQRAREARESVGRTLTLMLEAAEKREAERAELERLRREQTEREQRERDEKIAREAAERARLEAEAKAERDAAEAAARARAEQERVEREKAEALARAEKAEADRKAAAEKAERDRVEAEARARREQEEAVAAERRRAAEAKAAEQAAAAKREQDKKHRAKINNEARDALVATGITGEQGTAIVTAIARGEIPHVKISY